MSLIYDREWFKKFRELAVTDIDELVVGETYYTNSYPAKFVLKGLLTNAEAYTMEGLTWRDPETADEIAWFEIEGENNRDSLNDSNIGASYNPWLIFKSEAHRDACKLLMPVTLESEVWDDWD